MSIRTNIYSSIRLFSINPNLFFLSLKVKQAGYTYLRYSTIYSLAYSFITLQNRSSSGLQVAEFGVGRGGSATILAWLVNRYHGKLSLYDVFGRIPAPTMKDGQSAQNRYKYILNNESDDYYGNIINLREVIQNDLYKVCEPGNLEFIQGKYEDMLPGLIDDRKFDLVHIDCDWYESSVIVYSYLQSQIKARGYHSG